MSHRLHNVFSHEPVGSTVYHYGYKCKVKTDGEVWAEIPDELLAIEIASGRVRESEKVADPISDAKLTVEEAPAQDAEPVVEAPIVAKVDGRTKAAKQSK